MSAKHEIEWKSSESIDEALACLDAGLLLSVKEGKRLAKILSQDHLADLVQVIAHRFTEPSRGKLADEILSANLLILLSASDTEVPLIRFLENVLVAGDRKATVFKVVENVLSLEMEQDESDASLKATAVSLICELGHGIADVSKRFPGEIADADRILAHIATFLMSVSNSPSLSVRLSLFQYFAAREHVFTHKNRF